LAVDVKSANQAVLIIGAATFLRVVWHLVAAESCQRWSAAKSTEVQ
jgi:hypothetical protein